MQQNAFGRPIKPENHSASVDYGTGGSPSGRPIATRLNLVLIGVVLAGTLFQLFGLPCILPGFGVSAAWLVVPIMLLQPIHWGLIHEAIHCHLLPSRRANEACARVLSVTLGLPFEATRFGHLVHHRFSRHGYDRPDVYDGRGPYALAWLRYWGRLFGGVYLGLLTAPLIACIPVRLGMRLADAMIPVSEAGDAEVRRLFGALVTNAGKRRRTQRDFVVTLALYGASAWLYGAWWPVLLVTMYARGLWHSFADNVAHHDVGLDEPERARDYALPPLLRPLVMNQHLHLTHHRHPTAPWTHLVTICASHGGRPSGNYFRAAFRQASPSFPRLISTRGNA